MIGASNRLKIPRRRGSASEMAASPTTVTKTNRTTEMRMAATSDLLSVPGPRDSTPLSAAEGHSSGTAQATQRRRRKSRRLQVEREWQGDRRAWETGVGVVYSGGEGEPGETSFAVALRGSLHERYGPCSTNPHL